MGTKWITGDVITFARMNQKTLIVQAGEPLVMYAGMLWFVTGTDELQERNALNNAWIDRSDHGALGGLADDDHAQYLINARHDLTARHSFLAGIDATGKLILTQIGTKVADLATLWTKATKLVFGDIDGLPGTIAGILTDHNKAAHDALGITPEEMDPSPAVNDTGSDLHVTTDTVGENVDPGEVLYLKDDGKYWLADADGLATMPALVMAMETILADAAGKLLHSGYFRHDAWNWTPGNGEANLLWASVTPGAMSQDQPVGTGDLAQVLGYVRTADIVYFNPSFELVTVP